MSNNLETVDVHFVPAKAEVSASGAWSTTLETKFEPWTSPAIIGPAAAALLALAGSATAFEENLWLEEQSHSSATAANELELIVGRAVSRAEALQITRRILERAEHERLVLAESEARRGIEWEDE